MSNLPFQLSDPSAKHAQDPTMSEYLRAYGLPMPPDIRYGFTRFASPQPAHRVALFGQAWVPPHALGTVVLVHGYAEHTANYARLVQELVAQRFAVAAMDLRGHGLSEGPTGHADSPEDYVEDMETFLHGVVLQLLPSRPLFLWAHSLGALVTLQFLQRARFPLTPAAAVFTSPLLGLPPLQGAHKLLAHLAPLMARVLPTLPISHGLPPQNLSHDEEYLARRHDDPLIKRITTPKWFESIKKMLAQVQGKAEQMRNLTPTLLMLAGNEKVTNLSDARKFALQAYSGLQHKVIEFPGMLHELEKEPQARSRVVSESIAWFKSHV